MLRGGGGIAPSVAFKRQKRSRFFSIFTGFLLLFAQLVFAQEDPCSIPLTSFTTLPNGWKVSTDNPNGVTWTNLNIRVPSGAIVYFDRHVTMTNCKVRMESNATIIVQKDPLHSSYPILTTQQQTIFFGCTAMWNGIEFGNGSGYNLSETTFRNSTNGLMMKPGNLSSYFWVLAPSSFNPNNARIQGCTFNKNYISIKVHQDALTGNLLFLPGVFSDNTFVSDGNNLLSGQKASTSISFKNCNLGIIGGTNNTFDRTGSGIKAENSGIFVFGGTIKNMRQGGGVLVGAEHGVLGTESSLLVQKVTFENVDNMLSSDKARFLTVDQCTLKTGHSTGIKVSKTNIYRPSISITKNVLEFTELPFNAIRVERSPVFNTTSTQNIIEDNQITIVSGQSSVFGVATKLVDITAPNGGTDNFPIKRCTLTVNSGVSLLSGSPCHGIYLSAQNAGGYDVDNNRVFYNPTTKPNGASPNLAITFEKVKGQRNKVTGNQVYATLFTNPTGGDEGASWIKCAFHLDESPNLEVCGNTGNNTYRLFHMSGSLDYCDFAQNDIQTHWQGLICSKQPGSLNTVMGLQLWHENTWMSTASSYTRYSAYHQDFPNGVGQLENGFKVDPDFTTHMPPGVSLTPPKVKPSNWFSAQDPIPGLEEENSDCIGVGEPNPEPPLGGWDGKIIDGTYPYESPSQSWDAHRDLSYKLLEHPEARPVGSVAQAWYDAQVNSSPWQFARFEQLYFNAFKIPTADQTALDNARSILKTTLEELTYLESLQNADPSEDATIRQQQSGKAAEVVTAQGNFIYMAQQANSTVQTTLNTTETHYNSLPTAQIWESNRKALYGFWLKRARGEELTETELNLIRGIANQCPLEGGFAVREIPLLLPVPEAYEYSREDYWYDCVDSVQGRQEVTDIVSKDNLLSIYPNPARNEVSLFMAKLEAADWTLTDMAGRIWRDGSIGALQNSVAISTESLPSGLYFCTVRTQNGLLLTRKVIIQH